jgi:NAD(P)-dependent dehydrogenase (short-subunit alcohol dehydrogenase family)
MSSQLAVIIGAGSGLSASLARLLSQNGHSVVLAARNVDKLAPLVTETGATAQACDVSKPADVERLFAAVDDIGVPSLVVFNASGRQRGPIAELDPELVREALMIGCFGGFLVGRAAAARMLKAGSGAIFFTGATASVKGFAGSAGFAMPKFGLRGLAQSMARELQPKNIHVAHFIIDGGIAQPGRPSSADAPDRWLEPDAIARTYLDTYRQHRSTWSFEVEVRPWLESF